MALKKQQGFDIWEGKGSRHRTPGPTWGFGQRAFNGDGLGGRLEPCCGVLMLLWVRGAVLTSAGGGV